MKTSNINVDSMRKINDFKNDAWKVERVPKTFENLNSFLDEVENTKNDANILKTYFFGFSLFFAILDFFETFIKKVGQKLGNNMPYDLSQGLSLCKPQLFAECLDW